MKQCLQHVQLPPLNLRVLYKPHQQFSFAFVTLQNAEDMATLQAALHLKQVQGHTVRCCKAEDKGWVPPWRPQPKLVAPPKKAKAEAPAPKADPPAAPQAAPPAAPALAPAAPPAAAVAPAAAASEAPPTPTEVPSSPSEADSWPTMVPTEVASVPTVDPAAWLKSSNVGSPRAPQWGLSF